jgi:ADP-ribosyltransferase exoenzyme
MQKKIIHTTDLSQRTDELPTLFADIRTREPASESVHEQYIRIRQKIKESYDWDAEDEDSEYQPTQSHKNDVDLLHSSIKPFIPHGKHSNYVDNYIADYLRSVKEPKLTAHHALHVLDVIGGVKHDSPVDNRENRKYLMEKWGPLLTHHARDGAWPKSFEVPYTEKEIRSIPASLAPVESRVLHHYEMPDHYFELHPQRGLRYLGQHDRMPYDIDARINPSFSNVEEALKPYAHEHSKTVENYVADSAPLNRYLYMGGVHDQQMEEFSKNLSNEILDQPFRPTHIPDFHVYTGLRSRNRPDGGHVTDEHGNMVFSVPAFTSTSLSKEVAEKFAKTKEWFDTRRVKDVLKIRIPGGYTRAINLMHHNSSHYDEYEYLLDKNHIFKVHPEPTYHARDNAFIRQWNVDIHQPVDDQSVPFRDRTLTKRIDAAMNPNTPSDVLARATMDDRSQVRAAAAKNPSISVPLMHELSRDSHPVVHHALLQNSNLPDVLLHKFIDKAAADNKFSALKDRQNFKPENIQYMASHPNVNVRAFAASRRELDGDTAERLRLQHEPKIDAGLASNSSLSGDFLHNFVNGDESTQIALASNIGAHRETLAHLKLNTKHALARLAVSKNPILSHI